MNRVILVLVFLALVGSARADGLDDAKQCASTSGDLSIRYCTQAIQSGELSDQNLAITFYNRGFAFYGKFAYDRAIRDYDQAIRLKPDDAVAFNNRGEAYFHKGEYDRAIRDYDQAIRLKPDFAFAFYNRGSVYFDKGEYDRAIADYDQVIRLKPDDANVFYNRGLAYRKKGEYDRAIRDYDQAIRLKPDYTDAFYNRGNVYFDKDEYDRAIRDYDQAIRLKPDLAEAYQIKAWLLATARDASVRDGITAVRLARQAVRLKDGPGFRDILAVAYAEAGQFDNAVAEQERAIEMLRTAGRDDEVADFQARLDLYRRRQPFRE